MFAPYRFPLQSPFGVEFKALLAVCYYPCIGTMGQGFGSMLLVGGKLALALFLPDVVCEL